MGKPTGFLEFTRELPGKRPVGERRNDYKEFVQSYAPEKLNQQSSRCMNCGTPFCHHGCPLGNVIPEFNDHVYRQQWQEAYEILRSTNNFPEFTGRICPAPCESSCVLGINQPAVAIEEIEKHIIEIAFEKGFVKAKQPNIRTGKKIAVVGSGPAGLAAAAQLNSAGHTVTVFERDDAPGGLLRYGIPDFKLEKWIIDRRINLLELEGVVFRCNSNVGVDIRIDELTRDFHAIILCGGSTIPRDLTVPGRELKGTYFAMDFLKQQNQRVRGVTVLEEDLLAKGKHVVVIGGGDTGSDCVGTSNRHGAKSVTQFELLPQPPEEENKPLVWPYWPIKLRTSSSHEEGCERDWAVATKRLEGKNGKVEKLIAVRVEWKDGKMQEVPGSEFEMKADLVFLAMGFVSPVAQVLEAFGVDKDARGNVRATTDGDVCYQTSVAKVFAAGDMRRGQSLVVWAIREGRQCARAVDQFLMGSSVLPR